MRFDIGRNHPHFNLNGGVNGYSPNDYKRVVRAAKDPVAIPTDPIIVGIAERCLCHLGLGEDCFTLTNVYGVVREIPYGASVAEWTKIAEELLALAIEEDSR